MTALARANLVLFALLAAHTLDHALNQPARDLPVTGSAVGVAGFAIVAASSVLAIRRSALAPSASALVGAATAIGLVAVHVLPAWSEPISDPYWDFSADAISWASLALTFAAAVYLAVAGLRARNVTSADEPSPRVESPAWRGETTS